MLFTQEDLAVSYDPISEAANILNEAVYLTEDESFLSPKAIPVVENTRIGAGVVQFDDIERLSEENGIDYIDSMYAIAEANEIDPNQLAVAVDEWKIIRSPEIVNELANVVLKPMSLLDPVGLFTEACVDCFVESGEYVYLDHIIDTFSEAFYQPPASGMAAAANKSKRSNPALDIYAELKKQKEMEKSGKNEKGEKLNKQQKKELKAKIAQLETDYAAAKANYASSNTASAIATMNRQSAGKRYDPSAANHGTTFAAHFGTDKEGQRRAKEAQDYVEERQKRYNRLKARAAFNDPEYKKARYGEEEEKPESSAATSDVKETRSFLQTVKHYTIDTPRDAIAKAITKLKEKYMSFERVKNANSTPENERGIIQKILVAIGSVLDKLSNLLTRKKD